MRLRSFFFMIVGALLVAIYITCLTQAANAEGSGRVSQSCDVREAAHYISKGSAFMRRRNWTDALYAFQAAFDARAKCLAGSTDAVWAYWTNVEMAAAYFNLREYDNALKLLSQADSWTSSIRLGSETTQNKKAYSDAKKAADLVRSEIAAAASRPAPAPLAPYAPTTNVESTSSGSIAVGTVSVTRSSCDYFIASTPQGYALLEWYGGWEPSRGDVLSGSFETYGFHTIYDRTADSSTRVWVEDYWLSLDDAYENLNEKCE